MRESDKALLAKAQQHYQAGQFAAAERLYRQVLQQYPQQIEILTWLALITEQTSKLAESAAFYERILALNPASPEAHSNLGAVLCRLGQIEAAIAHQQQALQLMPQSADAHYNLGVVLYEAGQVEAAIEHYQQAIGLEPTYANAHNNLGVALCKQQRQLEAIEHYRQAVTLNPNHANAHNNLGVALFQQRQLEEAIAHYRQAIAIKPDYFNVYDNLGTALKEQGQREEAIAHYQQAIALAPDYASAYDNLGTVFQEQGQLEEAIAHYRQAIAIDPNYANAYNNLGSALKEQGKVEEAIACCQKAIQLQPNHADAHNNYGSALVEQGRLEEAIDHFEQAIRYKPELANAHLNLGIVLLMLGNFQRGFVEYHWRWQTHQCPNLRYPEALWDGSDLQGRVILLTAEQGFGDTIQFARYAPLVAERGGQVVIACQKSLLRLLSTLPGIDRCVDRDRVDVQTHVHAPLLDLPMLLGTTLETIPAHVPYLSATPTLALPAAPPSSLKIGIVWSSNPANSTSSKRSCPLHHFLSLLEIPGITLYSLQKDLAAADRELLQSQPAIQDLSDQLQDFADTAAAIVQLDLVISVDTAVAHLAGALGQPVWTLLPAIPDWRWLMDREDTAWYPTMRLFRQSTPGDWEGVFASVMAALRTEFASAKPLSANQGAADSPEMHLHIGFSLFQQGQFAAAIARYQAALALKPNYPEAHNNWGVALCQQGHVEAALPHYQEAIRMQPDDADAHLNLGIAWLLLGHLQQGFAEYHWRWQTGQTKLAYPQALWDGSDLSGKTILLTAEQGLGDTIQFARYAPLVAQRGGRVVIACQNSLLRLLASLPGIDRCIDRDRESAEVHVHAPLLELPRIFGTTLDTIPAQVPYLLPPADTFPLGFPAGTLKVGIVWASHSTSATAAQRSCVLTDLLPLLERSDITFYSLQKQCSESERTLLETYGIRDLDEALGDFADTAAAIAQLDLVISIDTAVAHLAGAMGKPVWTLLPAVPDWRWLLHREDSPWYPTMRLFRQPRSGDWAEVVNRLAAALADWVIQSQENWSQQEQQLPEPVQADGRQPLFTNGSYHLKACRHGVFWYDSNDDFVGRSLEQTGGWCEETLALLKPVLRPGDTVVELGANIGVHTVFFARTVGATGKVIAIEGDRLRFQTLCANLALNQVSNVDARLINQAEDFAAAQGFLLDPLLHWHDPLSSPSNLAYPTLDRLPLLSCRLLKLEVAEQSLAVLQGAVETLKRCQPIVYVASRSPEPPTAVIRYLDALGYQLYRHGFPLYNSHPAFQDKLNVNQQLVASSLLALRPDHHVTIHGLQRINPLKSESF